MADNLKQELLWLLKTAGVPQRVAQLRENLPSRPEALVVIRTLKEMAGAGLVTSDAAQRWTLTARGVALTSAAATSKARRKPSAAPVATPLPKNGSRSRAPQAASDASEAFQLLPVVFDRGLPPTGGGERVPDESQEAVVHAEPGARLVVEAGPGFGKTEVACARVAWLIDEGGLEAESILLLSFTRTAVREMRARIKALAKTGANVGGVDIRTLDSFAWQLRVGSSEPVLNERVSYDESIGRLLGILDDPSDAVLEYLHHFDHIFVDEAQDLTGDRARLVSALVRHLRPNAGFTLFLDPAQAIYGWEDGEPSPKAPEDWTWEQLLASLDPAPLRLRLDWLHRTREPYLRSLLLGARALILDDQAVARARRLRAALSERVSISDQSFGDCVKAIHAATEQEKDTFILFRTRAEALDGSSWLSGSNVAHRLRFGALPQVAAGWIALIVNHLWAAHRRSIISRLEFEEAWLVHAPSALLAGWDSERAWSTLRRMGPVTGQKGSLDTRKVADKLAVGKLPDELFLKDVGPGGPIVGTVHGSKGREAQCVVMTLRSEEPDTAEEALYEGRVLYVALSRAKERLLIVGLEGRHLGYLPSRRVWAYNKGQYGPSIRIEVGRDGDVDVRQNPIALDEHEFRRQQAHLARYDGRIRDLAAFSQQDPDNRWRWYLRDPAGIDTDGPMIIGVLSQGVNSDVWDAIGKVESKTGGRFKPRSEMRHVRLFDVTTVAVARDYPIPPSLPEPWRSTRMWLSPVVSGLGRVSLDSWRKA